MTTGLTLYDEFAGAGGSTQGAAAVPGVEPVFAANHNKLAVSKAIACPPSLVPTGGRWRRDPASTTEPMAARVTRENDAVATLPQLVLVEGRDGHQARPVSEPELGEPTRVGGAYHAMTDG